MENSNFDYKTIPGWGSDIDDKNDPTYPIKNYTGVDHNRLNWERPPLQHPSVEILKSVERPGLSAVVGTTIPPSGLSGRLRRYAFTFSESEYGHWLNLLLADRINVVEGFFDDIRKLRFPNILAEKGTGAEWKYNRNAVIKKALIGAAVVGAVCFFAARKKKY